MGEVLAIARTGEAERRRRALGPSERAVGRLLETAHAPERMRRGCATEEEFREALGQMFAGTVTFGGATLVEMFHAYQRGDAVAVEGLLVKAGANAYDAFDVLEQLGLAAHNPLARGALGRLLGTASVVAPVFEWQVDALHELAQANACGRQDAAVLKYASVWSRMMTDFLYGDVTLPEHELLPHLGDARARAVHDAFATMTRLRGERGELAEQLRQALGTPSNARRALVDGLLERAGLEGLRTHAEAVR